MKDSEESMMSRKTLKTAVVAFKVEAELADFLNKLPNKSAFIRKAISAQLGMACPLCNGAGVVPRGVHDHYAPLLGRFNSRSCDGCGHKMPLPRDPGDLDAEDRSRLEQLRNELKDRLSHPDWAQAERMGTEAIQWLIRHHSTLADQRIGRTASREQMEELLRESAPEQGQDFSAILAELQEKVMPHAFRTNHPRFLAFIPSAPNFVSVLGELLCAGTNFFGGVWLEAAGPTQVELVVLDWFRELLGMPVESGGSLTSGGSEANLTALIVARESLAHSDRDRAVLYVTEQRHWSMDRAAKVIGL